jgi:hypothetical protein
MLEVKDAVKVSLATFGELFPAENTRGLRLEEVNLDESNQTWEVTVSYKNPDFDDDIASQRAENTGLAALVGNKSTDKVPTRHYKTVRIKAEDGSLLGIMNEWELH